MKKTILTSAAASVVTMLVGTAQAAPPDYWLNVPSDNLYGNPLNWLDGVVTGYFLNDSTVTAITVGAAQGVNSGTLGTTVNGPFSIAAPTSSYSFTGGNFVTASGSSFTVAATATAPTQTINSNIYIGGRANSASNAFTANAPGSGTSKFIINGNYNYQTTVTSGVTTAGISMVTSLAGATTGYGVFNGIIADGNTATGGVPGASVAGNVFLARNGGTWELNGANTFSGGVELQNNNGSTTILGNKSALGTGAVRILGGNTGFTLRANTDLSGANAVANPINFNGGVGTATTTNAVFAFTLGSNTATLNSGTAPAVGDLVQNFSGSSGFLPTYTRVTGVSGTTVTFSNAAAATGNSGATSTAAFTGTGFSVIRIDGTNNLEFSGPISLTTAFSNLGAATDSFLISNTGTTTFSGVIQQLGGVGTLNKQLTGTLVLTAANTYTGSTTINNGGGTVYLGSGVATFGAPTAGVYAPVTVGSGANVGARTSDNVTIPNAISGLGKFLQSGTGTTTLTGANTYSAGTTISAGTLNVGGINSIGGANYGSVGGVGLLFNGTGGTLQFATTPTSSTDISADSAGVAKLVTFTASAGFDTNGNNVTFANTVGNGGSGGLAKIGAGTLTVTSSNYLGATVVKGGTLNLKNGAQAPVLTGTSGADVQGGKLVLDYANGSDPISQIKAILDAGYALPSKFATGRIRSTTLAANVALKPGLTLGYGDDTVNSRVTIRTTLGGDSDLDGDVDFDDFLVLQTNFSNADTRFDQGNFDYSGATDFNDFLVLQTNFGQSVGGFSVSVTSAQVAAMTAFASANLPVPEPTSLALAGVGGLLLGRRRRTTR